MLFVVSPVQSVPSKMLCIGGQLAQGLQKESKGGGVEVVPLQTEMFR